MDYHADTDYISHSMMEVFPHSPARYCGRFVDKSIPPEPPTPQMQLGSLVHTAVLEPDEFESTFLVADGCNARRGNKWKAYDTEADDTHRTAVLPRQVEVSNDIANSIRRSRLANSLIEQAGLREIPILWQDNGTGLKLKCKPDQSIPSAASILSDWPICLDIKTSATPSPKEFAKQAYNFGYHRQAAHYLEGCEADTGEEHLFLYIVAGNEEPYDIYVNNYDPAFLEKGHEENHLILARIAECHRTGHWIAPEQSKLTPLMLPWATRKERR